MKLLLDTHLLLWWLTGAAELSGQACDLIASPDNTIFVSAVSLWEIWLKQSLGKLRLPVDFDARLARQPFENLPLSAAFTEAVASLPWHHRDPFDRMLVAQAKSAGLRLLTADRTLAAYGEDVVVASA